MKIDPQISGLLSKLDGRGSDAEWAAVKELRAELDLNLPQYLLEAYKQSRSWRSRVSYVHHAIPYARRSNDAIVLAELALSDKSKVVCYRACMLLAISQRSTTLQSLHAALSKRARCAADIAAAIDAIEQQNPNYFIDRGHTGKVTLNVEGLLSG